MKGSSVVEVLIALLIFSIALMGAGFLSLQGLKITQEVLRSTQKLLQHASINEQI